MRVLVSLWFFDDLQGLILRWGRRPPTFTIKSSNFHINFLPLLSMTVQKTCHEHRYRSGMSWDIEECPSRAAFVIPFCSVSFLNVWFSNQRNLASTSMKHSDAHKFVNLCSNPAKLSTNEPPYVISGQACGTDYANGPTWTPTIVMLVILTFQKDNSYMYPKKVQHEVVWPACRPNCQKNTIRPHQRHIPPERKPCCRRFGVDCCISWESVISMDKLRRIWRFWFYLSSCENSMSCQHHRSNQHMHFPSLLHTLPGLNEYLRLSVQHKQLLYLIWYWRLSQDREKYGRSTKPQQDGRLSDTQPAEAAHWLLQ